MHSAALLPLLLPLAQAMPQVSLTTSALAAATSAPSTSALQCPTYWALVAADLKQSFLSGTQCTDMARAAIRFAFHDAFPWNNDVGHGPAFGGTDGSLLLNPDEINRPANAGLEAIHAFHAAKFASYKAQGFSLSAADLIQFAGALGIITCPLGSVKRVLIGRADSTFAAPDGLLPNAFGPGSDQDTLLALFAGQGFSAKDLAALVGAHSTARAFNETDFGIPSGGPLDSTPGTWDVKFYSEVYNPPAGANRFDSDINLSERGTEVGEFFASFVNAQAAWNGAFNDAWDIMHLSGMTTDNINAMVDCTAALFVGGIIPAASSLT